MRSFLKLSICTATILTLVNADTIKLDEVEVVEKVVKNKDKPFTKASAVSTRENIAKSTQSIDDIVRSMPGTFTNIDKSSGTVSLNVRGTTGFGRTNTMIDGVSQTYYAASTDGGGRGGGTSQFGANIDPSFLAGVDVERGTFSGLGGINSLMGSANFRTIGLDDVITDGHNVGFMSKFTTGTNATARSYMGALAYKHNLQDGNGYIGGLYAYGLRKISQDYKIGGRVKIADVGKELLAKMKENGDILDKDDEAGRDTTPYNPSHLNQKPSSHMLKLEYLDAMNNLVLSYRKFNNKIAGRKILSDNYQLNYTLTNDDNINLNFLAAYNISKQKYAPGIRVQGKEAKSYLEAVNKTKIFDISNTFPISLPYDTQMRTTIGMGIFKNNYSKNRHPHELNYNLDEDGELDCYGVNCLKSIKSNTFAPDGNQNFHSIYVDNTIQKNIFKLDFNANVQRYNFKGGVFNKFRNEDDFVKHFGEEEGKKQIAQNCQWDDDIDEYMCDDVELNIDKYGSGKLINTSTTLAIEAHELFTPFITYSTTQRAPNIKEMFFSSIGNLGVNTNLKPEKAKTWQFGVTGFSQGVFSTKDKLGFKATTYKTNVDNYIFNVYHYGRYDGVGFPMIRHINNDETVTMRGLEIEFSYDIGWFYTNLAYARQTTNQPNNFTDASSRSDLEGDSIADKDRLTQGYGASKIALLPKDYGSLELGTRLFNQKLTIGGIMKYYGKSKRTSGKNEDIYYPYNKTVNWDSSNPKHGMGFRKQETIERQPLIYDLYVSYEPIENLVIKAEIQNVFDKKYIDPLDSNNDSASQTYFAISSTGAGEYSVLNNYARGRTGVLSFTYKY